MQAATPVARKSECANPEILDESDNSGNITNEYVFFGGKRIAMDVISSGSISSTYYYAEDFLGSSRAMVQAGATTPCFDADFLPFGREKDAVATCNVNSYKFEGKERDAETGNDALFASRMVFRDDFGARYYSSNFGRWLSPDWSSVPSPVPYANLANPQTLNLYAMVEDDPESFADLDGHQSAQSDPNVHAGQTGCNLDTGNGCPELALLVIGGNGMAHSLGVGEVLEEIGELIALQDHGQFTIADLGISDPAKAIAQSAANIVATQPNAYLLSISNKNYGPGDKCNEFVADAIEAAGLPRPQVAYAGFFGIFKNLMGDTRDPDAHEWADPNVRIAGWSSPEPVSKARAGDVIAQQHNALGPYGHSGIVALTKPDKTASVNTAGQPGVLSINAWGFRPKGQNGESATDPAPVVRHYIGGD